MDDIWSRHVEFLVSVPQWCGGPCSVKERSSFLPSDLPTREEGTAERSLCVTSFVAFNLSSAPAHSIERVREEAGKVASRARHWPYSCDGRSAGIKETFEEVIGRFLSIVFREAAEL